MVLGLDSSSKVLLFDVFVLCVGLGGTGSGICWIFN